MTHNDHASGIQASASPSQVLSCTDLQAAITHHTQELGFRLDMIMPADAPRIALLSKDGITLRLEAQDQRDAAPAPPEPAHQFLMARARGCSGWIKGRAGMHYRDLLPGRLAGRVIASHIRIPDGGPVLDYVHYHEVGFQMIYCKHGWVRVVYEDQGQAFVMQAGDCVLQPPTIRHRVLEASAGLEVIEIGTPAEHPTWRDHSVQLPTARLCPDRLFAGQRFVRHIATEASWQHDAQSDCEVRDTGIFDATNGLARVRVLRIASSTDGNARNMAPRNHNDDFLFLTVLDGRLELTSDALGTCTLDAGDACLVPRSTDYALDAQTPVEVLEVALPRLHHAQLSCITV